MSFSIFRVVQPLLESILEHFIAPRENPHSLIVLSIPDPSTASTCTQMFSFGDISRSEIAVSCNISVMLLLHLISFGMLYFQFISKYFLISFVISSLIHCLLGSGF